MTSPQYPRLSSKLIKRLILISTETCPSSRAKITHKYTLGDTKMPTFCVRYDYNDKYIAAAMGDGSIKIFNVFTQTPSYILNEDLEEKMPTTNIR